MGSTILNHKKLKEPSKYEEPKQSQIRMCILGGGGYLGQCLAKSLQNLGHYVVILDLQFQNFSHIIHDSSKLTFVQGSILNEAKLDEVLSGADACFHLAGYGMTGGASLDRVRTRQINVDGTRLVLLTCARLCVPRLIYAGSISVVFRGEEMYNSDESTPYAEMFENPYAESKCLAEKDVLATNTLSNIVSTCVLRFRGIYGPGELRTTQRTVNLCLSGIFIAKFRKFSKPALTQYSNAENCVNALILAEKSLRAGVESPARGQVYNIVDDGPPVDTFDFWEPLLVSLGRKMPSLYIPYTLIYAFAWLSEMLYLILRIEPIFTRMEVNIMAVTNTFSIEKARRELGYQPVRNHDLRHVIQFYKEQRHYEELSSLTSSSKLTSFSSFLSEIIRALFNPSLSTITNKLPPLKDLKQSDETFGLKSLAIKLSSKNSYNFTEFINPLSLGCALDLAAMIFLVQIGAAFATYLGPWAQICANFALLNIYFGVVALRYGYTNAFLKGISVDSTLSIIAIALWAFIISYLIALMI